MSHKFKGSALKCEVAVSIFSGDIVWICGPHRGSKHDPIIFREALKRLLDEGEMAEADQGHAGKPEHLRVRDDCGTKAEKKKRTESGAGMKLAMEDSSAGQFQNRSVVMTSRNMVWR